MLKTSDVLDFLKSKGFEHAKLDGALEEDFDGDVNLNPEGTAWVQVGNNYVVPGAIVEGFPGHGVEKVYKMLDTLSLSALDLKSPDGNAKVALFLVKCKDVMKMAGLHLEPELKSMVSCYLACARFASTNDEGESLDELYDNSDFDDAAVKQAYSDILDFWLMAVEKGIELENYGSMGSHGNDLWLTRNRHGAGFWDRGYGPIGKELSDIAKSMGSASVLEADDGKLTFVG